MTRRIFKAAVFLLLGAIVNIAVAWGIVIQDTGVEGSWWANRPSWRPITRCDLDWIQESGAQFQEEDDLRFCQRVTFGFNQRRVFELDRSTEKWKTWIQSNLAGWPFKSFNGELGWVSHWKQFRYDVVPTRYMWVVEIPLHGVPWPHFLPICPLWPGFAINTFFYAATLWLLFAAPFALRRRRRLNHGLCPACAYPIGVSDRCTECGAPLPARANAGYPASPAAQQTAR